MLYARFDSVTLMTTYTYTMVTSTNLFAAVEDVISCPTDSICCYYQITAVEGEAGTSGRAHMSTQPAEGTLRFAQIVEPHGNICYCVSIFLQRKRENPIFLGKGKLCSKCTVSDMYTNLSPPLPVVEELR